MDRKQARGMGFQRAALSTSIDEKIDWARECSERFKGPLLQSPAVRGLLEQLKPALCSSREAMAGAGIIDFCRKCDREAGGSCCGAGLENKYDGWLLIVNLLLGVELPSTRQDPGSCFFLGAAGCVLLARHVICINYLCPWITDRIDPSPLAALREREGEELAILFRLKEQVKSILRPLLAETPLPAPHPVVERGPSTPEKSFLNPPLRKSLQALARFFDHRKVGDVGPLGFRRSTHLTTLLKCLDRLLRERIIVPDETCFLDMGCADGRVNVFLSYLVKLSVGIELDEWTFEENGPLTAEAEGVLQTEGLLPLPKNTFLFHGDATDEGIHASIACKTGVPFEAFDLFYTYLVMHEEFAELISERGKPGAIFMVYGFQKILPVYPGFRLLKAISPMEGILAFYRKV